MIHEGLPDRETHGLCFYCHKWYRLSEGTRLVPEATGPLTALRGIGGAVTGDESALKFVCHRCAKRRRLASRVIFGTLIVAVLVVLLLERLGLI